MDPSGGSWEQFEKSERLYSLKDRKHEDSEGKDISDEKENTLASFRKIRKSAAWMMIYLVEALGIFPSWSVGYCGTLIWN